MSINYQNDSSFFICLNVLSSGRNLNSLFDWFTNQTAARFRFIHDPEILEQSASLQQVLDIYPGVKTIALVMNPWARVKYSWDCAQELKSMGMADPITAVVTEETFEEYVTNLAGKTSKIKSTDWFTPLTPQVDWLNFVDSTGSHTVDYVIKEEDLSAGIAPLQEYFMTTSNIFVAETITDYRSHYNDTTKQIVADIFVKDLEAFGYSF